MTLERRVSFTAYTELSVEFAIAASLVTGHALADIIEEITVSAFVTVRILRVEAVPA